MDLLLAFIWLPLDSTAALYLALFSVLILSGIGLPVPEEVTLLLGGYLAYLEFVDFRLVLYVLMAGIVAADIFGYFMGRFAGEWIYKKISFLKISEILLGKAKWYFDKHGEKVVLLSRPLLGVRVAVPVLAGHFKMNFAKFVLYDLLGAIPWTVFLVSLSYYLGSGLDLITGARELKHGIFAILALVLLVYAGVKFVKNNKSAGVV